jgi:hypothetical protein
MEMKWREGDAETIGFALDFFTANLRQASAQKLQPDSPH